MNYIIYQAKSPFCDHDIKMTNNGSNFERRDFESFMKF